MCDIGLRWIHLEECGLTIDCEKSLLSKKATLDSEYVTSPKLFE